MNYFRTVILVAATLMALAAARVVSAQTPSPPGVSGAVSGAGVSSGTTATYFGVTITNRLNGDVTISLGGGVLTVTSVVGTTPFTFTPNTGAGCTLQTTGRITVAECPAPRGSTFVLVPATGALPITGTGGLQPDAGVTWQGALMALSLIGVLAAIGIGTHVSAARARSTDTSDSEA